MKTWKKTQPFASSLVYSLIIIGITWFDWYLFAPGNFSADSLAQYQQAITGIFDDWHPPILAMLLRGILSLGGGAGTLILLQAALGGLGIFWLMYLILKTSLGNRSWLKPVSLFLFLLLLSPLTPLSLHLVTFWKDTWFWVGLVWLAILAVLLYFNVDGFPIWLNRFLTASLLLVISFILLVRHNGLVLAPALIGLIFIISLRIKKSILLAASLSVTPFLVFFLFNALLPLVFPVTPTNPISQVLKLDLVGMMVNNPNLLQEFPYTQNHLATNYTEKYRFGDVAPLYWEEPRIVSTDYQDINQIRGEYIQALIHFPGQWLGVKLQAYTSLLDFTASKSTYFKGILENPYGLRQNREIRPWRDKLTDLVSLTSVHPVLRWVSSIHLVWMLVALAGLLFFGITYLRRKVNNALFWSMLWLIPVLYYFSYFLATTALDFRLLYPATLFTQTLSLPWVVIYLAQTRDKQKT
jgi:hypothetical protein